MTTRKTCLLYPLVCILIFTGLHAQDSTGIKWNLEQCLAYAKIHSVEINTYRLGLQTNQQNLAMSRAAKLPNLGGAASQNITHGKNFNSLTGSLQSQTTATGNYSVSSNITIYNGGYLNNDIKQKELLVQSSNLEILQGVNDITLQVTQDFLNILLDKENIIYLQDLVNTSNAQVKQEQQLFDAGSIAKNDLVQLQAQSAADQYNLITTQNALRQNIVTLKQLLLLPYDTAFDIAAPDSIGIQRIYPALSVAENTAIQTRPEIKVGELSVRSAELDLAKARAGLLPVLSGTGALSSGYSSQSGEYFRQLDDNFFQQLGLSLSIPIFSRRVPKTAIENSKIEIAQNEINLENTKSILSQQVEQAYINVQNAEGQYDAAVTELNAAQEGYRIANEELKQGAVNTVQLLLEKNAYIQALEQYTQAKYNAVLYIKIYAFYMGEPVTL